MDEAELPPLNSETVRKLGWAWPLGNLNQQEVFQFARSYAGWAVLADRRRRGPPHPQDFDAQEARKQAAAIRHP